MLAAALAMCLGICGCGKPASPANNVGAKMAAAGAKKTSTTPASETAALGVKPPAGAFVSVFSTNNPRDPFHPALKPKTPTATASTGPERETDAAQLTATLQAGFQGIYGSSEDRELLVYGVLMREKRDATVSIPGLNRKVKVRPLHIYRNSAELQVEGLPQPITVPKTR